MALAGLKEREPDHTETADPDAALMLAFRDGDEAAFVKLYERYRDRLVNYCRRILGQAALGEEAAQEAFLKLYRARPSYAPKSRFSTFLYRIATNHCLNVRARHDFKSGVAAEEETPASGADPERAFVDEQRRQALGEALGALPERQRAALVLCHYQGMSYRETAAVLEVSEGAVKSLVFRARESLVVTLGPLLEEAR